MISPNLDQPKTLNKELFPNTNVSTENYWYFQKADLISLQIDLVL